MTNPNKVLTTWTKLKNKLQTELSQKQVALTNLKKSLTDLQQENKSFLTQQEALKQEKQQQKELIINLRSKNREAKTKPLNHQLQKTYYLLDESEQEEVSWEQLQNKIQEFLVDYQKVVGQFKKDDDSDDDPNNNNSSTGSKKLPGEFSQDKDDD